MGVERIAERLSRHKKNGTGALLPYLTAGFPDLATTQELVRRADALGAAVVEIGIPYSDSIADGPVIQASFHAALARGFRVADVFQLAAQVRGSVSVALVAMVSTTLVQRIGLDAFMGRAAEAGFDGVILPDVPVEESDAAVKAAQQSELAYIGLVAPTTSADRRARIARTSSGFVYQMAVAGTTGERRALPIQLADEVAQLRKVSGLPVCVGFGVSTAAHVRSVCEMADGAIVGSAIVRRIDAAMQSGAGRDEIVDTAAAFMAELMTGTTGGKA